MKKVLHNQRFEIDKQYKRTGLIKTGDIFFRQGNEVFWGLPFSKLVAKATNSKYSHASIALVDDCDGEIYLIEVALDGTVKYRLIDWLDFCGEPYFEVWRFKESDKVRNDIALAIEKFLDVDGDYNLNFVTTPNRYYCTESIVSIYKDAGLPQLCEGNLVKDIIPLWKYYTIFLPINFLAKKLLNASMPTKEKLICVGNKNLGLMSSEYLYKVCEYG